MLSVRRGAKAVEFYKQAFGARELFRLDGENGDVVAQLAVGEGALPGLGGTRQDQRQPAVEAPRQTRPQGKSVKLIVVRPVARKLRRS